MNLLILSNAINFIGVALALWLGIFIITRSPRRTLTRVAALVLWAIAGYQLGNLTYYNQLRENANQYWAALFRWSTFFAPALWLHLSLCWLPESLARPRRKFALGAYLLAAIWTAIETLSPSPLFIERYNPDSPLLGTTREPNSLFPLFILYALGCAMGIAINLMQARRLAALGSALQRHLNLISSASLLVAIAALYLLGIVQLQLNLPNVVSDILLTVGIALMGYAVALESARLDGRSVQRDFLYSLLVVGFVCVAYLFATLLSYIIYNIPFVTFIFVLMLAVISHSAYDWARATFDRFFFEAPTRALRENLRSLAQEAGSEDELPLALRQLFTTLCQNIELSHGALLLKQGEGYVADATYRLSPLTQPLALNLMDEASQLTAEVWPSLALHPLRVMGQPAAALALGAKENGGPYSSADEDLIADVADRMEQVLTLMSLHAERTRQLNAQVVAYRESERAVQATLIQQVEAAQTETSQSAILIPGYSEKEFVGAVEDVLRHLNDIPHLGEHRLAALQSVARRLNATATTNLDKGRALKGLTVEALNKLRPADAPEPKQAGNEWYAYLILRDAYMLGVPNREIMARYYISEGTFNRTRRRAIRAVARALAEGESNW